MACVEAITYIKLTSGFRRRMRMISPMQKSWPASDLGVRRIGLISLPPIAFNHAYDWMTQQTVLCIISDMWLSNKPNKPAKPMIDKNSPSSPALVTEMLYPCTSYFSIKGFTLRVVLVIGNKE